MARSRSRRRRTSPGRLSCACGDERHGGESCSPRPPPRRPPWRPPWPPRPGRASKLPAVPFNFVPAYGERLSLEEARRRVDYPIRLPQGVGEPYRLFLSSYTVPHGVITAVYGDERHTRLVFTQWRVGGGDLFVKVVGPGSEATRVTVDGAPVIWLFGKPHAVVFVGADGREYRTVGALAGHTLDWQRNGKSYRLEAELSQATALELAESIH